jgi:hypothetical protein
MSFAIATPGQMNNQRRKIKMQQPASLPYFPYFMFHALSGTGNSSGNRQPPF